MWVWEKSRVPQQFRCRHACLTTYVEMVKYRVATHTLQVRMHVCITCDIHIHEHTWIAGSGHSLAGSTTSGLHRLQRASQIHRPAQLVRQQQAGASVHSGCCTSENHFLSTKTCFDHYRLTLKPNASSAEDRRHRTHSPK